MIFEIGLKCLNVYVFSQKQNSKTENFRAKKTFVYQNIVMLFTTFATAISPLLHLTEKMSGLQVNIEKIQLQVF